MAEIMAWLFNRRRGNNGPPPVPDPADHLGFITRGGDMLAAKGAHEALSPTAFDFTGTFGGSDPLSQTFTIQNDGDTTLTGLAVAPVYGAGWSTGITIGALSATTLAPGASATCSVSVALGSRAAGNYPATVRATSTNAQNSPATVPLTLHVQPALTIDVTGDPWVFGAQEGQPPPASQLLTVTNNGGATITGLAVSAVAYGAGWSSGVTVGALGATSLAPGAFTTATVSVNHTGITGTGQTLTATISVTSTNASNSPQSGALSLTVAAPVGGGGGGGSTTTIAGYNWLTDPTQVDGSTQRIHAQFPMQPGTLSIANATTMVAVRNRATGLLIPCISRALSGEDAATANGLFHPRETDANAQYTIATPSQRTPHVMQVQFDAPAQRDPSAYYDIVLNTPNTAGTGGMTWQSLRMMNTGGQFALPAHGGGVGLNFLYPVNVVVPSLHKIIQVPATNNLIPGNQTSVTGKDNGAGQPVTFRYWLYFDEGTGQIVKFDYNTNFGTSTRRLSAITAVQITVPIGVTHTWLTDNCVDNGVVITKVGANSNEDMLRMQANYTGNTAPGDRHDDSAFFFLGPAIWLPASKVGAERDASATYLSNTIFGRDEHFGMMSTLADTLTWGDDWRHMNDLEKDQFEFMMSSYGGDNRSTFVWNAGSRGYDMAIELLRLWAASGNPFYYWFAMYAALVPRSFTDTTSHKGHAYANPINGVNSISTVDGVPLSAGASPETHSQPLTYAYGYLMWGTVPDAHLCGRDGVTVGTTDMFRDTLSLMTTFWTVREGTNNGNGNYNVRTRLHELRATCRWGQGMEGLALCGMNIAAPTIAYTNNVPNLTTHTGTTPWPWAPGNARGGSWEQVWKDWVTILEGTEAVTPVGGLYQSDLSVNAFRDANGVLVTEHFYDEGSNVETFQAQKGYMMGMCMRLCAEFRLLVAPTLPSATAIDLIARLNTINLNIARFMCITSPAVGTAVQGMWSGDTPETTPPYDRPIAQTPPYDPQGVGWLYIAKRQFQNYPTGQAGADWDWNGSAFVPVTATTGHYKIAANDPDPKSAGTGSIAWGSLNGMIAWGIARASYLTADSTERTIFRHRAAHAIMKGGYRYKTAAVFDSFTGTTVNGANRFTGAALYNVSVTEGAFDWWDLTSFIRDYRANGNT